MRSTRLVGGGSFALFWEDRWLDGKAIQELPPDLFALIPRHCRKRHTLREALLERRWMEDIQVALGALVVRATLDQSP